jgi:polysaccharide export outer membrane protein
MSNFRIFTALFILTAATGLSQAPAQPPAPQPPPPQSIRPDYALGPNDQVLVRSSAEELNERPFRVDNDGFITFPLVNRIQVSGMTLQALEQELTTRLRQFFVQPQVSIILTAFKSEPVSFFGAFVRPGVINLTGGRTLLEMLAVVGGFSPNAGRRIRVTRRSEYGPIPLPSAIQDPVNGTSTVEISLDNLLREINPAEDIVLQAYDRVTVEQSLPVYVNGEANRAAPLELAGRESITVMEALSMVGGFNITALRDKIRVLRPVEGTGRLAQIEINLQRIVDGEENDFPLYSNDILYIPQRSPFKSLMSQAGTNALASLPYLFISALLRR